MIVSTYSVGRSLRVLVAFAATGAVSLSTPLWGQAKHLAYEHFEGAGEGTYAFISSEFSFNGKAVTGAPYSAEAVTETSQTLSDGNRIRRTVSSQVYRDSQGRTRQDQSLGAVGPWAADGTARRIVTIHDPVAGETLMLDAEALTARKMPRRSFDVHRLGEGGREIIVKTKEVHGVESHEEIHLGQGNRTAAVSIRKIRKSAPDEVDENVRMEELGSRNFGDVLADGTRTVSTIPAGAIGNELPIEVVSERWYSPDLQIVVMSRRYDPRFGETVYELRNLSQIEPDPGLFEVPEDYSIDSWTPAQAEFYSGPAGTRKRVKRMKKLED